MKKYELKVGENHEDEENIFRTSLVDDPATQKLFAVFSNQKENKNLDFKVVETPKKDKFERILSGVWFMPNTDYLRFDGSEFYEVSISKEELKKAVVNFTKNGSSEFNIMHEGRSVDGLSTMEIWVLNDYSQLSPVLGNSISDLGYKKEDVPLGTVFMTVFVKNETFFNEQILTGKLKGFSIEAFFIHKIKTEMSKNKEMFKAFGLVQEFGTLIVEGGELKFSKEGILLGDKSVADGEYKTASKFSVVVKDGKVVDYGFEEVVAEVVEEKAAETVVVETKTTETTLEKKAMTDEEIQAVIDKAIEKRESDAKAKKEADDKEAARLKEIADLKAENEELKKSKKIPATPSVKVSDDYDKTKFKEVVRGGKTHLVLK